MAYRRQRVGHGTKNALTATTALVHKIPQTPLSTRPKSRPPSRRCASQAYIPRSSFLEYTWVVDIDRALKETLEQLLELCQQYDIRPRLIGGLAVRGYADRKRFTHDIDLAITRNDKPMFISILKQMGFEYQDVSRFVGSPQRTKHQGNKTHWRHSG